MTEPTAPEIYRLFLAMSLPSAVVSKLEEVQRVLRKAVGHAQVRWTNLEQLHLTMRFLGNVPAERLPALRSAVTETCASFPALRLTARRVGFFPSPQKPHVIWAGVEEAGGLLRKLHAEIEKNVASFSAEEPEARFQAHVTLARVKQLRLDDAEQLAHAAVTCSADDLGSWTASHLDLIRSQLSSEGSHYTIMGNAEFSDRTYP